MRAAVDTNVWISALLNPAGAPARILEALRAERFTLVTSEPLLAELERVLARPRIARRLGVAATTPAQLAAFLRECGEPTLINGAVRVCRDPDDDRLIETALTGAPTCWSLETRT